MRPHQLDDFERQPVSQRNSDAWRALGAIRRQHMRSEHERREDSAWRKRVAAIVSGRFQRANGYTDETALDAFAPHPADGLEDRPFTSAMERREIEAWAKVEAARHVNARRYVDACRDYLRMVEAMERVAALGIKPLTLGGLRKPALHSLKLGAGRRWRAA